MVDKINGKGGYDYPSHNNQRKSPAVQAYESTPGAKEASKKKSRGSAGHANAENKRGGGQGVILDLSAKGREKERAAGQKEKASWLDAVRQFFAPVYQWLKNFWESDAGTKAQENDFEQPEDILPLLPLDEISDVPDYEPSIDEAVKSGSLQQVEQMLTRNGEKRLAHNSDLLTYYDRKGKIVEIDETEKHRVLYGDKNILKL